MENDLLALRLCVKTAGNCDNSCQEYCAKLTHVKLLKTDNFVARDKAMPYESHP